MKRFLVAAAAVIIVAGTAGVAAAQPGGHDQDQHGGRISHPEWRKGARMAPNDWSRGEKVDYRSHHLRAPPRGYEWRQVDGNYVLAAVATGLIASVLAASH